MGLAIVGIAAAALVVVLLGRLIQSTEELARLLRTERPGPVVSVEEDASTGPAPPSVIPLPDASLRRAAPRAVEAPDAAEAGEDAGIADAPLDVEGEDVESFPPDAGLEPEAAPLAEAPKQFQCGWRMCPVGEVCCNWSCSTCTPPGATCNTLCGAPSIAISIPCGFNTCNVTEICCNRSCGICVPSGETCSQEPCLDTIYDPYSAPCGLNTCNVGEVCCNPSCGICTKPGERCSLDPCIIK